MTEREILKRRAVLNLQAARLFLEEGDITAALHRLRMAIVLRISAERTW